VFRVTKCVYSNSRVKKNPQNTTLFDLIST
jgi:hypothetical protein